MDRGVTAVTNQPTSSSVPSEVEDRGGKFLTFFLSDEEYGLEILKVQEIIGMMDITAVPRTPEFIRGVINLRGKVIPIVDLRLKFGMEPAEQTDETCIIVVQAHGIETGIIVDKVSEVLDIAAEEIEEAPSFGTNVNTDYILGIGKSEGRVKLLLDIEKVLSTKELVDIQSVRTEGKRAVTADAEQDPKAAGRAPEDAGTESKAKRGKKVSNKSEQAAEKAQV